MSGKDDRATRLAAQLRANLKRRKVGARLIDDRVPHPEAGGVQRSPAAERPEEAAQQPDGTTRSD